MAPHLAGQFSLSPDGGLASCRDQEGRRGSEEAVPGPSVFPSGEPGVSGGFWAPPGWQAGGLAQAADGSCPPVCQGPATPTQAGHPQRLPGVDSQQPGTGGPCPHRQPLLTTPALSPW